MLQQLLGARRAAVPRALARPDWVVEEASPAAETQAPPVSHLARAGLAETQVPTAVLPARAEPRAAEELDCWQARWRRRRDVERMGFFDCNGTLERQRYGEGSFPSGARTVRVLLSRSINAYPGCRTGPLVSLPAVMSRTSAATRARRYPVEPKVCKHILSACGARAQDYNSLATLSSECPQRQPCLTVLLKQSLRRVIAVRPLRV